MTHITKRCPHVNKAWKRDNSDSPVTDLRKAVANDPKMTVMIAHGWDDLSCPYFGSKLILDQMPPEGPFQNIQLHVPAMPRGTRRALRGPVTVGAR